MYGILQILISENSPKYPGIIYCNSTQVLHHFDFFLSMIWNARNIFSAFFSQLPSPPCSSGCRWEDSAWEWPHYTARRRSALEWILNLAWDSGVNLSHKRRSLQWGGRNRWRRPYFCLWWSWCSGWWTKCEHRRKISRGNFQRNAGWQKVKRNSKASWWKWKRRVKKLA